MKTTKLNGVWFRGQYAENLELLEKGCAINMIYFNNGTWDATKQVGNFLALLNKAKVNYTINGKKTLRSMWIKIKEEKNGVCKRVNPKQN